MMTGKSLQKSQFYAPVQSSELCKNIFAYSVICLKLFLEVFCTKATFRHPDIRICCYVLGNRLLLKSTNMTGCII